VVETIAVLWGDRRFQARIRLGTLLIGQHATAGAHAGATERAALASAGGELAAATQEVVEAAGAAGPETVAWTARLAAEDGRLRWLAGTESLPGEDLADRWRAAVDALQRFGHVYETARSRARLAAVLQALGDGAGADAEVERSRAVAARLGAAPLLAELREIGGPEEAVRAHAAREAPAALARREAEVLALVADGRSNREIAQLLFISVKTVSVHISNVLAKLDASGRTEAVAIARRRGLLPG
jgi:DNA-binding CsgD family transcriptional regulator